MKWISVENELPDYPYKCLILLDNGIIEFGRYIPKISSMRNGFYNTSNAPRWDIPEQWRNVTHWMLLPDPPEK